MKTDIFAHRGSAGTHPENTMEAFQAALDAGADGLEFDVQLTKDHIPVIIHDETINRTTNGEGWIKDYTYKELKQLDAGSWFHSSCHGFAIPTLEQLFDWAKQTNLILNIELKNGIISYPGMEQIVLDLIKKYNLQERVIISSFNHYSLVDIHRLDPSIETAILYMEELYEPWNYAKQIGAKGLHCYYPSVTTEILTQAAEARLPVRPFTVNEDSLIQSLIKQKCPALITDWPEKAVQIRDHTL